MAMSKKDYEDVAASIAYLVKAHNCMTHREKQLACRIAVGMANRFRTSNMSFDIQKFLRACQLPKVEGFNC